MSTARTLPAVVSRRQAGTGRQVKVAGGLFGNARETLANDADAYNMETIVAS